MKKNVHFIVIALWSFFSYNLIAQRQSPFKAGVVAGVNISQIDGDYQFGYDKVGYNFGIRGGFALTKRFDIMTELLYIQKGTSSQPTTRLNGKEATIDYKYAEVPLLLTHHIKKNNSGFYSLSLFVGPSYGRLLKSSTIVRKNFMLDTITTNSLTQDKLNKTDISLIMGVNINFLSNLSLRFSHTTSLTKVYVNPGYYQIVSLSQRRENYQSFRNYYLSFQLFYDFIAPKVIVKKKKGRVK